MLVRENYYFSMLLSAMIIFKEMSIGMCEAKKI